MCEIIGQVVSQAIARRRLLTGAAIGATGLAAAPLLFGTPASAADIAAKHERVAVAKATATRAKTRLALLGTAGGPVFWPNTDRRSASSAVVVGDAVYMVDCGDGAGKRLQEALEAPGLEQQALRNLRALFLTHLHSDHVVDYPTLLLYGLSEGLKGHLRDPVKVFGPGRRGEMEPIFTLPGHTPATVPVMAPDNPTPGTVDMTGHIYRAFATDINDHMRNTHKPDPRAVVDVHDIELPPIAGFKSPNETPIPDMEPFKVYEDDRVRVTATLVYHFPIWPAFAFRFDTDDGAVVFSGDTAPSKNLIRMAKGADILVHEVIVTSWIDRIIPPPRSAAQDALRHHLVSAHTPVEEVGKVAAEAGVSTLVLNHIVPGNAQAEDLLPAQRDFPGQLVIGEDLLQLGIHPRRPQPVIRG